jgi:hypothetical protein
MTIDLGICELKPRYGSKPQQWDGPALIGRCDSRSRRRNVECLDEVTFEAPTNGYKADETITMSRADRHWKTDVKRRFYIKTGSVFGRIDVTSALYHDLYISVHYVINPSGSTNLETGDGARIVAPYARSHGGESACCSHREYNRII